MVVFLLTISSLLLVLSLPVLQDLFRSLETLVDTLLDDMREVLMLPAASLLDTFPRSVRDLAQALGKEVRLEIRGSSIEIDRRILDEMHDPLIHLMRNAIDHGIEPPAARNEKKKDRSGLITIEIQLKGRAGWRSRYPTMVPASISPW